MISLTKNAFVEIIREREYSRLTKEIEKEIKRKIRKEILDWFGIAPTV